MSDLQKELVIHDYLCKNVVYATEEAKIRDLDEVSTARSALLEGKAVCQGCSEAAKLLFDETGIESGGFNIDDGRIYYVYYPVLPPCPPARNNVIRKIKVDGTDDTLIQSLDPNEDSISGIHVEDGWIYCETGSPPKYFKMTIDGTLLSALTGFGGMDGRRKWRERLTDMLSGYST